MFYLFYGSYQTLFGVSVTLLINTYPGECRSLRQRVGRTFFNKGMQPFSTRMNGTFELREHAGLCLRLPAGSSSSDGNMCRIYFCCNPGLWNWALLRSWAVELRIVACRQRYHPSLEFFPWFRLPIFLWFTIRPRTTQEWHSTKHVLSRWPMSVFMPLAYAGYVMENAP